MGKLGAVIVAAGKGVRMGAKASKQFLPLGDKPLFMHALTVFQQLREMDAIVLVVAAADLDRCRGLVAKYGMDKVKAVVVGGDERQDSVFNGLVALTAFPVEWVMVHDAARPFVTAEDAVRCWQAARIHGAAVLGVPVKDTIKQVNDNGMIAKTPERRSLWAAQTPQAFRLFELMSAHERARQDRLAATDDAAIFEHYGGSVRMVEGSYRNFKVTTPDDLQLARMLLKEYEREI
ncbi:MAG TPA: 2-C-methyl-D-erythritol 4-phosphate cytidylyltransferase [Bacilli bacterium]